MTISQSQRDGAALLHLLFAAGKRPDGAAIANFTSRQPSISITHHSCADDTAQSKPGWAGQPVWVELLRDGLTFELSGLAPGAQGNFPAIIQRFDLPQLPVPATHEAVAFGPGPHLAGAARSQPVARAMLGLACDLVLHFPEIAAVYWGPSQSAIGRRFFESVVSAWLDGGAFPALGLTAFGETPDGALESIGLAFWIGQELRIEPPLSGDRIAATRLGVRLVNQLVLTGAINADERIVAPDGTRLVLRPARGRAVVSVWRE